MDSFFLLYALTISLELLLSTVMAIFLYLIVAPATRTLEQPHETPMTRPLSRSVQGALGDAFASISEGREDLMTITHARALLARYAADHRQIDRSSG